MISQTIDFGPDAWTDEDGNPEGECIYCHAVVKLSAVPAEDDDAAWEAEAAQHGRDCEWVETRAHRREANHA